MLLSAMSVLVVAQSSSEMPEGLMNNPVYRSAGKVPSYVSDFNESSNFWIDFRKIFNDQIS